jgi:hypothetical protein
MTPPASHATLDELLTDIPLQHDAQALFSGSKISEEAAEDDLPHVPEPHRPVPLWLPAPQTASIGSHTLEQHRSRTDAAGQGQSWPFIGAAATSNATYTGCCRAAEVSVLVDIPEDRGHLKATAGIIAEDRGHLRAAAASAHSAAHSKKTRAAWRPCYQTMMKVSSSSRHVRALGR